ncbi:hypothetical protein PMAC_001583 [Pneumocystis sp. 'macacae']|nr:hypothetical protein PMAC_001583 [Pneumocystis sp. 'macacae']
MFRAAGSMVSDYMRRLYASQRPGSTHVPTYMRASRAICVPLLHAWLTMQATDARVLVLHPGSRQLRIGLATDAFPRTVPNVIAHRHKTEHRDHCADASDDDDFEHAVQALEAVLRARLRLSKRRIQSNARDLVVAYNQTVVPEAADADAGPEWTDVSAEPAVLVGHKVPLRALYALHMHCMRAVCALYAECMRAVCVLYACLACMACSTPADHQALHLSPDTSPDYTLYWPLQRRVFNTSDYASPRHCIDDVAAILVATLADLGMQRADWMPLAVVLVIPDTYDKDYVEAMLDMLIRVLQFAKVCVLQESVCTVFGAGLSAACVVDVGAQATSVACVEEGICIPESRLLLPYGGDDVTRLLARLLRRNAFPCPIDLHRTPDWLLADTLKLRYCSANEASATLQLLDCLHASPAGLHRYRFKAYDEPAYFFPAVFRAPVCPDAASAPPNPVSPAHSTHSEHTTHTHSTHATRSGHTDHPAHPQHTVHAGHTALDDAIVHSILRACDHAPSDDRLRTLSASILLVGGGHSFPGFAHVLEDRLRAHHAAAAPVRLLSPPRDTDPQMLAWRGAAVFSQLKIAGGFWIKQRDWDLLGVRCLQYRSLGYFWSG